MNQGISYDNFGFDEKGIHKVTGKKYDEYGFDREGICYKDRKS